MPATGSHLRIQQLGEAVLGVRLLGNPRLPEPDEFRVEFPGGSVTIARTTDNDYWAHVTVTHEGVGMYTPGDTEGRITEARLDQTDKHSSQADLGDFGREQLYHLAVRVTKKEPNP